jgi:amino acid transporter
MKQPTNEPLQHELPRRLGLITATATVAGIIIGSGIFRVPADVAAKAGTPGAMLLVWVAGGILTLCMALAYAELATLFPRDGGTYVYIREAWGRGAAFVFGWTYLLINPAAWAAVALVFTEYAGHFVPMTDAQERLLAVALILLLAGANYASVTLGAGIQNLATFAKAVALVALALFVIGLGHRETGALASAIDWRPTTAPGFLLALVAVLWAYDGAPGACSVAGEVKDPQRTLPLALVIGVLAVTTVYLAANVAYLWVLPFESVKDSPLVASDAMQAVLGTAGSSLVAALVMVSTFGALAAIVMTDPRIFFAMARDGNFFRRVGLAHPRYQTPHVAIVVAAVLACLYVTIRTFEDLAATFVLGIVPFYALAAAGVLRLRRTAPGLPRPYRTPGYPLVPLVYVLGVVIIMVNAVIETPLITLGNVAVSLAGIPVCLLWRRLYG